MTLVLISSALVAIAVAMVMIAGASGAPTLALGVPVAALGVLALIARPYLGVTALVAFSHLDAVEKVLFGFLPVSAFKLISAVTLVAVVLNGPAWRDQIRTTLQNPIAVMAVVFLMVALVSFSWAEDKGLAFSSIRRLFSFALLLVLIAVLADTSRKVGILLWTLVATSVVSSLILIVDFTFSVQLVAQSDAAATARTVEGVNRSAGGSDYNPTTAAALLLVGVIFALVHAFESPVWRRRLLAIAALGTVAVVLSFARSAALAYGVIGIALLWRYRRSRYLPHAFAAAALAGLAMLPLVPDTYLERLSSIFGGAADPTLSRRWSYNLIGIDLFSQSPVLGVGAGNFVHHFTDISYRFMPGRTLLGRELHNMYLSVLVQYGILGALSFFGMLVLSFVQLRAVYSAPARPGMRVYALALSYAFAAYLLTCIFLPNEENKYTWLLPGIAMALYGVNERERPRE